MLYTPTEEYVPESYKDYRHRTMEKLRNRAKDLLSAIESCSLKGEDKATLKKEILDKIIIKK